MAKCAICDKSVSYGKKLSITRSHISNRATRTWRPNLRSVKIMVNGEATKVKVCAHCLRSGKLNMA